MSKIKSPLFLYNLDLHTFISTVRYVRFCCSHIMLTKLCRQPTECSNSFLVAHFIKYNKELDPIWEYNYAIKSLWDQIWWRSYRFISAAEGFLESSYVSKLNNQVVLPKPCTWCLQIWDLRLTQVHLLLLYICCTLF